MIDDLPNKLLLKVHIFLFALFIILDNSICEHFSIFLFHTAFFEALRDLQSFCSDLLLLLMQLSLCKLLFLDLFVMNHLSNSLICFFELDCISHVTYHTFSVIRPLLVIESLLVRPQDFFLILFLFFDLSSLIELLLDLNIRTDNHCFY